jgi:hypothetical protein
MLTRIRKVGKAKPAHLPLIRQDKTVGTAQCAFAHLTANTGIVYARSKATKQSRLATWLWIASAVALRAMADTSLGSQ